MREVNPYIKSRRERETKAFYRAIAGFVPIIIAAVAMSLAFPSPD